MNSNTKLTLLPWGKELVLFHLSPINRTNVFLGLFYLGIGSWEEKKKGKNILCDQPPEASVSTYVEFDKEDNILINLKINLLHLKVTQIS